MKEITSVSTVLTIRQTSKRIWLLFAALFVANVSAQTFVYPAKGQSSKQQKKDESACHTWAVQQSRYDPANPSIQAAATPPPTTATGTTPGAGVRGALRGAVVGEVIGGDARTGAAAGAIAARGQSRRQNNAQVQQQQQDASQQQQAGMNAYQRANAVCLEGRGYSVK